MYYHSKKELRTWLTNWYMYVYYSLKFTTSYDAVYESANRGVVEVRTLIKLSDGKNVELPNFKVALKHPIRNVMELCMNLSTNEAVLPVLISLMVHSDTNKASFKVTRVHA